MTVVVPVYNRESLVVRCLDSLKAQSYRPLHVIVVDNASTDDTLLVVKRWSEANAGESFTVGILSEPRGGAAYARQKGLEEVTTDKVMFFDSDDVMMPECISEVMAAWGRRPEADMVAWPVAVHHQSRRVNTHSITGNLVRRHLVHALFRTHGYSVRTQFLKDCGGWRGEFPVWNDFETGARLILNNPLVIAIGDTLVDVYPQTDGITGPCFSGKCGEWEKSLDAVDEAIDACGRPDAQSLHDIVSYRRAILAAHYAREGHEELALPLYREALMEMPRKKRPLIRFAYHWTRLGMRGAFSIIGSSFKD